MRAILISLLAVAALGTAPGEVAAQTEAGWSIAPSPEMLAATARLWPPKEAATTHAIAVLPATQSRGNKRKGEILMIVGAAGIVTGLLADEGIITIAGAGVGGFGLYLYLSATR